MSKQYTVEDLLFLMSQLRDPENGCPWDRKQTFNSIVPYTLEEVYEVVDAIEKEDYPHLKEELGDLLFQVIFYAQMGKEKSLFDFNDIVHKLVSKLVRRHPHVFPNGELQKAGTTPPLSETEIKGTWEKIKQQERDEKGLQEDHYEGLLDDIPRALPALQRAEKLQKRASTVGFDWPETDQVLDKIEEEIQELREALREGSIENVQDELGDVFFAMTNLSRHLGIKSEQALRGTNQKFERRFNYIQTSLQENNQTLQDATLDEMETLWQKAKQFEKRG